MVKKVFWGSAIILCVCNPLWASTGSSQPAATQQAEVVPLCQVAVFDISGPLLEAPAEFEFGFDMEPRHTLH